jgi:uncharacterized protein
VAYWVLLYDLADDYLERRATLRAEHLGLVRAADERGEILAAGALADPMDQAILVFNVDDPAAIEAFVREDPYVTHGLVTQWRIRPWTVVVGPGVTPPAL